MANPENLPVIQRDIATTIVFSSDGHVLLGRKDSRGGGVFTDSWHLPGGGTEPGESLLDAAVRELNEEVTGLHATPADLQPLPWLKGGGATTKTVDGRRVWCEMAFNYFRLTSHHTAAELTRTVGPGSDFVEARFFSPAELAQLPTIPGGVEDKIISGELTATTRAPIKSSLNSKKGMSTP